VQALRGINLQVERGEIFGFLGPNGAGKTTTIRCMLDMIRPNAGKIQLLGLDPQADPVAVQACTGYLPGEMQYYDNLTPERQLRFFNDMRGGRAEGAYIRRLAERLALDLLQPIKVRSKGIKQKLRDPGADAPPELLLWMNPPVVLTRSCNRRYATLLRQANAEGATVFLARIS
jgi:ABC-2 type transport system ATP-binding protein